MDKPDHDQRQDYDDRGRRHSDGPSSPVRAPESGPGRGIYVGVIIGGLVIIAIWMVSAGRGNRDSADRMRSSNNLKQIGIAIHNFHDAYGELPNNTYSKDGKPLLSWRVQILPFIEQDALYQQFKLDEPWDSPNNQPLLRRMPRVYAPISEFSLERTYYRGFSNPGAIFERRPGDIPRRWHFYVGPDDTPQPPTIEDRRPRFTLGDVKDSTSNTILVVEAGDSVEWTKPDDLDASPDKPFPRLGGMRPRHDSFQVLMGDGSIRPFQRNTDVAKLRALITHSGDEAVTPD